MRALTISWEYPPYVVGGMGKHVAGLVPALGGQPLRDGPLYVDVVTPCYGGGAPCETLGKYVNVYRVDMPPIDPNDHYNSIVENNGNLVQKAQELAADQPYDIIHIHDWLVTKAGVALKSAWKTPLVTTIHATERGRHQGHVPSDTSRQIDRMEWRSVYEAWAVIVCSTFMSAEVRNYFELPAEKVAVIPNGIDLKAVARCSEDRRLQLRHQYAPYGERLLLFVGRIVHEKGLHILIRALPRILAEHPNTRLLVAGKNSEKMWSLAYELNVEWAVRFLGFISDEDRDCLYQIADAAIFPSIYEPFGIVALEAMATGCNVIVSNVGGFAEVVQHLQTGLTVYPNDPLSIAWAVNRLFSDPAGAATWRENALRYVEEKYSWRSIAAQTAAVYQKVADDRDQTDW
jgi:glycosyltransferase involved in cell wall biosynthesis